MYGLQQASPNEPGFGSRYAGVVWDRRSGKWQAVVNGVVLKDERGGAGLCYDDEKAAAEAYDRAWLLQVESQGPAAQSETRCRQHLNFTEASMAWFRSFKARRDGSKYHGVVWARHANRGLGQWKAVIQDPTARNGKCKILGLFDEEAEAARAYDHAALGLNRRVPDAELNFPADRSTIRDPNYGGKSAFRGVCWNKRDRKWLAQIHPGRRCHRTSKVGIGSFATEEEAARAYDARAIQDHGAHAVLNFHDVHGAALERLKVQERQRGVMAGKGGRSLFRGVFVGHTNLRWTARCGHQWLGCYDDEVDAARAYDRAARQIYGPNATLNFPTITCCPAMPPAAVQQNHGEVAAAAAASIDQSIGRRLEYKFLETDGASSWSAGTVKARAKWDGWYKVDFDDGQLLAVLLADAGRGQVWRWTTRCGTHMGSKATASASASSSSSEATSAARLNTRQPCKRKREPPAKTGPALSQRLESDGESETDCLADDMNCSGAKGPDRLISSVFASDTVAAAMRRNTWQTERTDEPALDDATMYRLPIYTKPTGDDRGMGAYASKPIGSGTFIGEYSGEIIR
jgi:hypothetical protein